MPRAHKDGVGNQFFFPHVKCFGILPKDGLERELEAGGVSSYLPPTERSEMA